MHPAARLLLLLAAVSSLSAAAATDDEFVNSTCSAARSYTDNSPYGKDVTELQNALATPGDAHWWFRSRTIGQVSGLAMCYADADVELCLDILNNVSHYRLCDHSRSLGYLSSVGLAYGYTPSTDSSGDPGARLILSFGTNSGAGATAMREARVALLSRLAERAGSDALRFAAGTQGYNDTTDTPPFMPGGIPQVMYGMAQCALDLPAAECSSCLVDLLANTYSVMFVNNSTSARLMELRCYLRYQINQPITFIPGMVAEPPEAPPAAPTGSAAAPATPLLAALLAATLFITVLYY
ncbi:unnamed protein product [Urochloa humidicola]